MRWELAGYPRHPVDGEPDQVMALAEHLRSVADGVGAQIDRLQAFEVGDFWVSGAGSAESFQEAVGELPKKLELVAERYGRVAAALDAYYPLMGQARQDAEYWIAQAEDAQAQVDRAEVGVQAMEDFEALAQQDAEAANENRSSGDPEAEPDEWEGEDYRATLAQAQDDLETAVANCRDAVEAFARAHDTCAEAIEEAGNDKLKNEEGLIQTIMGLWSSRGVYTSPVQTVDGILGKLTPEQLESVIGETEYGQYIGEGVGDGFADEIYDGPLPINATKAEMELFYANSTCRELLKSYGSGYIVDYLAGKYHPTTGVWAPHATDSDPANAMKHAEFAAILTVFHGEDVARIMMDAHENIYDGTLDGRFNKERMMDLYNNSVGIEIGLEILEQFDHPSSGVHNESFDPNRPETWSDELTWDDEQRRASGVQHEVELAEMQVAIDEMVTEAYEDRRLVWLEDDQWEHVLQAPPATPIPGEPDYTG